MKEIFETVMKIAPTDATVLISGESGTGKELIANAIHQKSKRLDKPFIKSQLRCIDRDTFGKRTLWP